MSGVDLLGVSKQYGKTKVIDGLSLHVQPHEFIVFLGPSGCGKSTLLRMIAGLETVDGGEIRIGGERVDHLPPGQRGVALVFQQYALYPHMTIRQNMAFGLENIGTAPDEIARRVDAAAESLEISALLDRKPGQLSGGQRQRVAIGRAIVKNPKVFLFDEPLSNLDAALRVRTRVELAQLHRRVASTMIFVTHDQVEAMTLADRIVVMNGGKVEQIGTPLEIYNRPATAFVAAFVGSPTINLLPVSVEAGVQGFARAKLSDGAAVETQVPMSQALQGEGVRLGARPEAIGISEADGSGLKGTAEVVERLGDRTSVHVRIGIGEMVVAEDSGTSRVRAGDVVTLTIDGSRTHLFDPSGQGYHSVVSDD